MFEVSVKNEREESLNLTASDAYDVISTNGLAPVPAVFNMQDISGYDGAVYLGGRLGSRNIIITLAINKDVESNRIALYNFFKPKENIRIYYKNCTRNVYIDGFVESFDCDFFTISQQCQISIICPDPYFKEKNEIEISRQQTVSLFEFPFENTLNVGMEFSQAYDGIRAIIAGGSVSSGIIIEITALSDYGTQDPHNITILNIQSGVKMTLSNISLSAGDKIHINTFKGYKQIYLKHEETVSNKIGGLADLSKWIEIQPGNNTIAITDNSGELPYLKVIAQAFKYYEGV